MERFLCPCGLSTGYREEADVGSKREAAAHVRQPHLSYAHGLTWHSLVVCGDVGTGSIYIGATPKVL